MLTLFTVLRGDDVITLDFDCDGIIGYAGNDTITIENGAAVNAEDDVTDEAIGVFWTIDGVVEGNASGTALSDSSAMADAMAVRIDGGTGMDEIINTADILADVCADATAVSVGIGVGFSKGAASADASSTAKAVSTGIQGGSGDDWIENTRAIAVGTDGTDDQYMAIARAASVTIDVGVTLGMTVGEVSSGASATAKAISTGIDGGEGNDDITNDAAMMVNAGSDVAVGDGTNVVENEGTLSASSDHNKNVWSAAFGAGYTVPLSAWMLQPFESFQYAYLDEESFEESGADALNLRIDDRQTESLVSELGLRLSRIFSTRSGNFIPEISLGWKYDYGIDDRTVTASFAGSPSVALSING